MMIQLEADAFHLFLGAAIFVYRIAVGDGVGLHIMEDICPWYPGKAGMQTIF